MLSFFPVSTTKKTINKRFQLGFFRWSTFVPTSTMTKTFRRKLAEKRDIGSTWKLLTKMTVMNESGQLPLPPFLPWGPKNKIMGGSVERMDVFFFSQKEEWFLSFYHERCHFPLFYESGRKSKPAWILLGNTSKDVKIHLGSQSVPSTKGKTAICRSNFRREKNPPSGIGGLWGSAVTDGRSHPVLPDAVLGGWAPTTCKSLGPTPFTSHKFRIKRPFWRGPTTPGIVDLRSPWLLTTNYLGWSSKYTSAHMPIFCP